MALEAILAYRAEGLGSREAVPLGVTTDLRALRAIRDAIVQQARQEALHWKDVDEGIFALRAAEFERIAKVLAWLLPDGEHRADLRLVKPGTSGPPAGPPGGPT